MNGNFHWTALHKINAVLLFYYGTFHLFRTVIPSEIVHNADYFLSY